MLKRAEIHDKVWGSEEWVVNNKHYCGKLLNVKKKFRCSTHFHKKKRETFYLLSGLILLEVQESGATCSYLMREGDSYDLDLNQPHRFTGLEDSVIFEFSTQHFEDDSYRSSTSEEVPDKEFESLQKLRERPTLLSPVRVQF